MESIRSVASTCRAPHTIMSFSMCCLLSLLVVVVDVAASVLKHRVFDPLRGRNSGSDLGEAHGDDFDFDFGWSRLESVEHFVITSHCQQLHAQYQVSSSL
jgi:hypothetical protein